MRNILLNNIAIYPCQGFKPWQGTYYKNLIIYINNNPVHHGFVEDIIEYPWTSYLTVISNKPTHLQRDELINWFDDVENFIYLHKIKNNNTNFERYIIE